MKQLTIIRYSIGIIAFIMLLVFVFMNPALAYMTEPILGINIDYHQKITFVSHEYTLKLQSCNTIYLTCSHKTNIPNVPIIVDIFKKNLDYSEHSYMDIREKVPPKVTWELIETIETQTNKHGKKAIPVKMDHEYEPDHHYLVVVTAEDVQIKVGEFWLIEKTTR